MQKLILPHGGYRKLRSFQTAQIIYDATVIFCDRLIEKYSRTRDQMIQAARSGVQNIAEGSMASATSKKTELKLTGVARASLEELLLDYQDFLRQRGLRLWPKDSPEAMEARNLYKSDHSDTSDQSDRSDRSDESDPYSIRTISAEKAANTLICLINQASFLLARQIAKLEQSFLNEGGFTERLYRARLGCRSCLTSQTGPTGTTGQTGPKGQTSPKSPTGPKGQTGQKFQTPL
jgi:restriction system protein